MLAFVVGLLLGVVITIGFGMWLCWPWLILVACLTGSEKGDNQ